MRRNHNMRIKLWFNEEMFRAVKTQKWWVARLCGDRGWKNCQCWHLGKLCLQVIYSPNVPLCLYDQIWTVTIDQIWTVTIDQIWTVTIDPQRQTNMTENIEMFMTWERNVYLVSDNSILLTLFLYQSASVDHQFYLVFTFGKQHICITKNMSIIWSILYLA